MLRIAGKRALSKLNAFDFVVTIAFGSTLATVLLSKDVALAEGALALLMLALLQFGVTKLSLRSERFKQAVRSKPTLLAENGRILEQAMTAERIAHVEIEAAVRSHGIGRMEDVGAVVLETDGSFSVIGRGEQPLTVLGSVRRIGSS
jgi:uncharacterized membrane protein YcaP (DUF421 family)